MKTFKTICNCRFLTLSVLFLLSCSNSKINNENGYSNFYFNSKYENSNFNDATMSIVFVDLGLDTLSSEDLETANPNMLDFAKTFNEYFPIGIKNFSTIKKVNWLYYPSKTFSESVEYNLISNTGNKINISLPYSMQYFKDRTNADFIFL